MPEIMTLFDVIVAGYGYAGAMAAITAADQGARVLLLEKRATPGGISVCSAGGVRYSASPADALAYLVATNAGTTPRDVLKALADGMALLPEMIGTLASAAHAKAVCRPAPGNYPFKGHDAFGFINIDEVADFDPARDYPNVRGSPAGARLFKVFERNVQARGITVRFETAAEALIIGNGRVTGLRAGGADIHARGGVILATGGFEGAPEIQRQFWPMQPVLSAAIRSNTGDGLKLAQSAGASLWHMWHYHGSYGFRHPDPAYPFGIRLKRLPDWLPGAPFREDVTMSWIVVDRTGRRFMNEYEPYMQDTGHRALEPVDFTAQQPAHLPAVLIVDAPGRAMYPLSAPAWNDDAVAARFSHATPRSMDADILAEFATLDALAGAFNLDAPALRAEIADWNALAASGSSDRFGRPGFGRAPIATPPFSAALVRPVVSNTQGGPAHDARQRVLGAFGLPIPGLYKCGEIGSVFGHIYLSGGNLAECFAGGRIAGLEAAAAAAPGGTT